MMATCSIMNTSLSIALNVVQKWTENGKNDFKEKFI